MKLLKYNATFDKSNESFKQWKQVNEIIFANMPVEMKKAWMSGGYAAIADLVPEHFGMHRLYRDDDESMTFEFTEEQWTWFAMKWL